MTNFTEIENLIKDKHYEDAMIACEEVINLRPENLPEVCRLRSWIFTRQGNYRAGVDELVRILESPDATIADFHSAAFWSLYDGQFERARDWLAVVLELGRQEDTQWFESSALFYMAYIHARLGHLEEAERYLKLSGDLNDDSPVVLPVLGALSRRELHQLIKAAKK